MQNTLKHEVNYNSRKNKLQLFALIGLLVVTALAGSIYSFFQSQDVPPSLEVKRNTYQGFSKDVEFGSLQWNKADFKSDVKVYDDKIAELKKAGVDVDKGVKADKDRTNVLFATRDTNLKEIVDATSRQESGRVIWAVYKDTFIMTQNDYFNTVDSKGNVTAKIIDTSNTTELEKIKIKENEAVFIMADYQVTHPLLRSELDVPAKDVSLDSLTKGFHAVAVKDVVALLKDVDPSTYSIFATKNNFKNSTKLKSPEEKKDYNSIVWINAKVDKLVKNTTAANVAPVVTMTAIAGEVDSTQNMPI